MHDSSELNESVRQAVINYSDSLIKIAFAYLKNVADAEEVAQDVFLAYLQAAPDFKSSEHEKAWLILTVINKSKNMLKTGWFRSRIPLPDDLTHVNDMNNNEEASRAAHRQQRAFYVPVYLMEEANKLRT